MSEPNEMDTPPSGTNAATARVEELLFGCLEEGEAHLDAAVEELCAAHPDRASAIREAIEAARSAGLNRDPGGDDAETGPAASAADVDYQPIGPYQPLSELGRGGQGVVFLAEDTRLHRVVALKVLKGFGPLSEKMMQRFKREAEVASKLDHPGICSVYDAGVKDGIPYIAMRYVEGKTLAHSIRAARVSAIPSASVTGFLELDEVVDAPELEPAAETQAPSTPTTTKADVIRIVDIVEKAARALHAAHEAGIIHRDVKPGNIMVPPSGDPVVLDFGLASEEANELSLTQTGDMFGTPAYMSPEQLMAHHIRLDRRTDVYSLAVALYECVTLQRPFEAPTREAMYQAIQYKHAPDVRKLNREIPGDLAIVLEKALEKDRDRRYETAIDFAEDLRRVRELKPIAAKPVSAAGRVIRWAKRRPFRAALVAALIVGAPAITGLASYAIAKQPEIEQARKLARAAEVEGHLEVGYSELAHGDPKRAMAAFDAALALAPRSGEAIGGKAIALRRAGDYAGCLAFLEAHRDADSGAWALEQYRIDALHRLGRAGEARDLERATTHKPETALDFFLRGLSTMGDCGNQQDPKVFRRALAHFRRAALTAPHARAIYHIQLAHVAGHLAKLGERSTGARDAGEVVFTRWPDSTVANTWVGYALRYVDPERAIEAHRRAIALEPERASLHYELGATLGVNGRFEEAIVALRKALELNPNDADAHLNLGFALSGLERYDEAIAACEKAIALNPGSATAHNNLGAGLRELGRIDASIEACEKAIELKPDYASPHNNLGMAAERKGRREDAIAHYRKAIELDSRDFNAHNNLAGALLQNGELEEALAEAKAAITAKPDFAFAHNTLGVVLLELDRLDEAIAACRKAIELRRDYATPYVNLGRALERRGRPDDAIAAYRKATGLDPEDFDTHNNVAVALRRAGRFEEALVAARAAIRANPDFAFAHNTLGVVLNALGKPDESFAAHRKAVQLDSNYVTGWQNLGRCLRDKKDYDGALEAIQRAIGLDDKGAKLHLELGVTFQAMRRLDDAITAYRKATELDPNLFEAQANLGTTLTLKGAPREAIVPLKKAIALRDDAYVPQTNLAGCYYQLKRFEEAVPAFERSIELLPTRARTHRDLACSLMKLERRAEAMPVYRRAIDLYEKEIDLSPSAQVCLADCYQSVGDLDNAIASYREVTRLRPEYAEGWCNLGQCCAKNGQLRLALEARRRGHELGSRRRGWKYESAKWLKDAETAAARKAQETAAANPEDADAWHEAIELLETLTKGWRRDLDRDFREADVDRWLQVLAAEPWTKLRAKTPPAHADRWRAVWTTIDELTAQAKKSR